jgi:protein tyrosine phosphatase (PTP) superfamily phosphohydrolase (DUF442 family)
MKLSVRTRIAWLGCGLILAALVSTGPLHRYLFRGNLVEVIPGEIYRSAQPSVSELSRWTNALGLRSLLNLRRGGGGLLEDERQFAAEHALEYHLVGMSSGGMPPPAALRGVVRALDSAPRPLLLHCGAGIERSGLAATLARLLAGDDPASARAELSLARGYSPHVSGSDFHRVIDDYQAWLDETGRSHEPAALRHYVERIYAPYYYRVEIEPIFPPDSMRVGQASTLRFRITNHSRQPVPFRAAPEPGTVLAARIHALDPHSDFALELRGAPLELDLVPGATTEMLLPLPALPEPGRYQLMVDLIDGERMKWLGELGSGRALLELRAYAPLDHGAHRGAAQLH